MLTPNKSSGVVDFYHTSFMWFGPPKIGKTSLWAGLPNVLGVLGEEGEVARLKNIDYVVPQNWVEFEDTIDELCDNEKKYKYQFLSFDPIQCFFEYADAAVCNEMEITHRSDAGFGKGYKTVDAVFKRAINKLFTSKYGLVFVAHTIEKQVVRSGGQSWKTEPLLDSHCRQILLPLVHEIGCVESESYEEVVMGKKVRKERRIIRFEPTEYVDAGDRDGVFPSKVVLKKDIRENYLLLKSYYEKAKGGA